MTNTKRLLIAAAVLLTAAIMAITSFAASGYKSPAEALAALTNKNIEEILRERWETGKNLWAIASENGVLEKFKAEMFEMKKDRIEAGVANGSLTREKADALLKDIEEKRANCEGGKCEEFGRCPQRDGRNRYKGRGGRQGMTD